MWSTYEYVIYYVRDFGFLRNTSTLLTIHHSFFRIIQMIALA